MKAAMKPVRAASPDAEEQLKSFIDKFDAKNQALIRALRKALRKRLPTANELLYDNYNFLVIGYCPSERPSDCMLSMAADANGARLCFLNGATLADPHGILLGTGKQNRYVILESAATLARPEVEALIVASFAQGKTPLPTEGRGKLIVRCISAKQRPRRKPTT